MLVMEMKRFKKMLVLSAPTPKERYLGCIKGQAVKFGRAQLCATNDFMCSNACLGAPSSLGLWPSFFFYRPSGVT